MYYSDSIFQKASTPCSIAFEILLPDQNLYSWPLKICNANTTQRETLYHLTTKQAFSSSITN